MKRESRHTTWFARHCLVGWWIVCAAATVVQGELTFEPSWELPDYRAVRQQVLEWVNQSPFDAELRTQARSLWPSVELRADRLDLLQRVADTFAVVDKRAYQLVAACNAYGLGVLPYFPLASGFLTGKYRPGQDAPGGSRLADAGPMADRVLTEQNFEMLTKLEAFAQSRGHSMVELAIGWLASQPHVASVISGATKPEQVEQNVLAAEWKLTAEEMAEVNTITRRREGR